MLHTKQASNLLQDLFSTLTPMGYAVAKVGNRSCSRFEACLYAFSMNYCCDHDIHSSKSVANAGE